MAITKQDVRDAMDAWIEDECVRRIVENDFAPVEDVRAFYGGSLSRRRWWEYLVPERWNRRQERRLRVTAMFCYFDELHPMLNAEAVAADGVTYMEGVAKIREPYLQFMARSAAIFS